MNTEDYVTYEQAVKLKELGFDYECHYFYDIRSRELSINKYISGEDSYFNYNRPNLKTCVSAPTLSQAAKWLREKGLFIYIWLCVLGYGWNIDNCGKYPNYNSTIVAVFDKISGDDENSGMFTTYEKALSNAIDKALEILE